MAKKIKTAEPKEPTKQVKERPIFDEYVDLRTLKTQITSSAWAERVAIEIINWAENDPEAFKLNEFFRKYGIDRNDIIRLQDRYPILKKAYDHALVIVGDKREKGAAHVGARKQWDPAVIMPSLGRFDPDYKEFMAWKAKMAEEGTTDGKRFIILEKAPDCPEVPKKKDNKNTQCVKDDK